MRRYAFLIFVALVFAAMGVAVLLRAAGNGGEGQDEARGGRATPVAVHTVGVTAFSDIVEALGTARANESVTITAKVSDVIARLEFDSGDQVEAGQILVELADAEEAAGLSEARATLRETARDVERIRDLTTRGVAPRSRLDEAVASNERALARVTAIEARVADRIIRAPFSGVVGLRNVSVGELVRPGDVIAQLDDASVIKLDFTVPERFLAVIEPGLPISAISAAFPGVVFEGAVDQVDTRIDPATRAVTVRAIIDNADSRLRPGMLMTVEMRRAERDQTAVPGSAIVRFQDDTFVFIVEQRERGAHAVRRDVQLGQRKNGVVEVVSGVEPGELVGAEGGHRVRDGGALQGPEGVQSGRGGPASGPTSTVSGA